MILSVSLMCNLLYIYLIYLNNQDAQEIFLSLIDSRY